VLTDEQKRNGIIGLAYRWPNRVVPYVIDGVFSKYCCTKSANRQAGRGGDKPRIKSNALAAVRTGG